METATLRKGKIFGPASFYKKALLIALPVMLQMLIQNMVSLIDNFMVSGLGDVKMSGVNISGQILFVFMVRSALRAASSCRSITARAISAVCARR